MIPRLPSARFRSSTSARFLLTSWELLLQGGAGVSIGTGRCKLEPCIPGSHSLSIAMTLRNGMERKESVSPAFLRGTGLQGSPESPRKLAAEMDSRGGTQKEASESGRKTHPRGTWRQGGLTPGERDLCQEGGLKSGTMIKKRGYTWEGGVSCWPLTSVEQGC